MIEITRFRPRPGVGEGELRAADSRVQAEFAYRQPGLLRRTTARGSDGEWLVIELWRREGDAEAAAARRPDNPAVRTFAALMDTSTVVGARYVELDG